MVFERHEMYESYYRLVWTKKTGLECRKCTGILIAKDKKKPYSKLATNTKAEERITRSVKWLHDFRTV